MIFRPCYRDDFFVLAAPFALQMPAGAVQTVFREPDTLY